MDEVKPLSPDLQHTSDGPRTLRGPADKTLTSPGQARDEAGATPRPGPEPAGNAARRAPWVREVERHELGSPESWMAKVSTAPLVGEATRVRTTGEQLGQFRIISKLGEGGMGVVYQAVDLERSQTVALKTLQRMDAEGLGRLKNEFRAVADIVHPNLVSLYELFSIEGEWFFTMELIHGVSFLAYVRNDARLKEARLKEARTISSAGLGRVDGRAAPSKGPGSTQGSAFFEASLASGETPTPVTALAAHATLTEIDAALLRRLRPALRQLAAGVHALHSAGKLHRDLKPGNVMVTHDGRVVVLDFGLARNATLERLDPQEERAGTPAYMAPEQAWGRATGAAADWYAVGAMLYQALTGRLPFEGSIIDIMKAKRRDAAPPPPSALVAGVPADLDELCAQLLQSRPEERPGGAEVLARLTEAGGVDPVSRPSRPAPTLVGAEPRSSPTRESLPSLPTWPTSGDSRPSPNVPGSGDPGYASSLLSSVTSGASPGSLIGREAQFFALEEAYGEAAAGGAATVYVHGRSGMGKTALVRRFLEVLQQRGGAILLEGRCYERESVPYKAFDSLVDSLARYLRRIPPERRIALLPADIHDLARMFPVLQGLQVAFAPPSASHDKVDPQEMRQCAFRGLKALLGRIGREQPLVAWIDDLQWGDRDSAHLLAELLAPPDPPPLLLVCTYRSEEAATSPLLRELFGDDPGAPARDGARRIEVKPLPIEDAARLALSLMGRDDEETRARAAQIARESEGNPLFVEQLVQHAALPGGPGEAGRPAESGASISLEGLIRARLSALPEDARRLLEVVAVAGRPLPQRVALEAADLEGGGRGAVAVLCMTRLARTRGSRHKDAIDIYHDRIRERAFADLEPAARARHHLRLATALEATEAAEPEELARHFHAAGELRKAGEHAIAAADRANAALAFDHAAELYRLAIECHPQRASALQLKCAEALVNAGRCAEAAPLYLAAANGAPALDAIRLRGRAAEQLLVSGRVEGGIEVLRPSLRALGLGYPETPGRALVSVLASFAKLTVRGTGFVERRREELSEDEQARLEVCWGACKGLLSFDSIRAGSFLLQYVLLSFRAGDPEHVARALLHYGMMTVFEGTARAIRKGTELMDEAERIAQPLNNPSLRGNDLTCRGIAAVSVGRFQEGVDFLASGMDILKRHCRGVRWEISTCQTSTCSALLWLGSIKELGRRAPAWLREAERIGDVFSAVELDTYCAAVDIAACDLEEARERLHRAVERWYRDAFTFQHWNALKLEIWADLHEGRPAVARARLLECWPALESSQMLRVRLFSTDALLLRANVALACASGADAARRLREVERDANALAKLEREPSGAAADLVRAQLAEGRGDDNAALRAFDAAIAGFGASGLALHAACALRRKGELLGGDHGRALVARADAAMHAEEITDPARWAAIFAPGVPGRTFS